MKKNLIPLLPTRRSFIKKTVSAGGFLIVQGLNRSLLSAVPSEIQPLEPIPGSAVNSPIIVVTQPVSRDVDSRAVTWTYITEILHHAGLFFDLLPSSCLSSLANRANVIVVLAGDLQLTPDQHVRITSYCCG